MPRLIPEKNDSVQTLLNKLLETFTTNPTEIALVSAARTATTQSLDIDTQGYSGITVFLHISAASGTGGLSIRVRGLDAQQSTYVNLGTSGTATTTASVQAVQVGRGIGSITSGMFGPSQGSVGAFLPDICRIEIVHADASSYTYKVNVTKHGK